MTPQPHQQRVIQEKQELDQKADKLQTFLASPPSNVDPAELSRLRVQHAIMDAYAQILTERIQAFEP